MPSKTKHRQPVRPPGRSHTGVDHLAFVPLVVLTLGVWFVYRFLFQFDIWFDETIGKAIFFGLPVWLYVTITQSRTIVDTFEVSRLKRGLLLGIAFGGIFGFAATLFVSLQGGVQPQAAPLFTSDRFWWEFFLSLMTGFWETLFFFSWIMVVVQEKYHSWTLGRQVLLVAAIFVVFHLPNTLLRFNLLQILPQLVLLFLFAVGQAFIFARRQNSYTLAVSHAIWGMVLLVHTL